MPILHSREGSSPLSSSPSDVVGISPSPTAITTSSPTFSFSQSAPTSDVVLVAFICVGLFIATIGASYLIFKSLGVSEWYYSRRLLREHQLRKNTENEARTESTADAGEPGDAQTPTTISFPSPVTPSIPEMRSNHQPGFSTRGKHFEYSRGSSPISACLQPGVLVATRPAPPVPSLPAAPPTVARNPGKGDDRVDMRTLAHKHIRNTKLLFAHQFNLLRIRGATETDGRPNGEAGGRAGVGRIRTSISSPSSLISAARGGTTRSLGSPITPTSPRTDSLRAYRVGGSPGSPTPSLLQQAADSVVGAHPNPSDISVITPLPAVLQLLGSPELGKHYQFDFPWVERNADSGTVVPQISSVPALPQTNSGSGRASEEGVGVAGSTTSKQSPPPRTPPTSQLKRGMFGDTTTTLHRIAGNAVKLSPPPPPFSMINNGKYPGAGGRGSLDQLEKENLDLSLSLSSKAIRKKPSRKLPPPVASSNVDGSGVAKENVDPNGSPKLLTVVATAASQGRKVAEPELKTGITSRSVFGISRI